MGLTQLASPRFEEKEALTARQMGDGKLLDHPQLGGDFRPAKMADWTSMVESLIGAAYKVRSADRINQHNDYRKRPWCTMSG